ncbi:MAG: hypothetical protein GXY80_12400 [Syntrophorhabdus aromaticivorans]|uniref:Uncharacterized protein n=1 Tax=Syntrophorhabdus aromaticivorans TaxID=328301 RepID=A0A971S1M1_9BACT|nr:hypothetical protein [Syntrophorhabdus aromaticivorans]
MDQRIRENLKEVLNTRHLNICVEVDKIKNLLLACEHAAVYAEENSGTLHEPPEWSLIFQVAGETTEKIVKAADDLFDAVIDEIDKIQAAQNEEKYCGAAREIQRKAAVVG